MPATVRLLIEDGSFDIRPLSLTDDAALDRPLSWVHSSDLLDPTPWLEPGNLLLTNGAQFSKPIDEHDVVAYCQRLRDRDVAGVGFATDVIHARVPDVFAGACSDIGLPVVEIANRAPFIGIIRFVADIIADDRAARLSWLLDAQRAVTRAGVRDDGLREILRALAQHLRTWVTLYDAAGAPVVAPGVPDTPDVIREHVEREVRMLLARKTAASLLLPQPDGALLQTIGQSSRLRGVLVVGAREPLDPAEKDLVGTVVALASLALEQQRQLQMSLRSIRSGIIEILIADQPRPALRVAETALGGLPTAPFTVGVIPAASDVTGLLDDLDVVAIDPRGLFFAERGSDVVLLMGQDELEALGSLAQQRGFAMGLAHHGPRDDVARSVRRAKHAAQYAEAGTAVTYEDVAQRGLVGALRAHGGELVAESVLHPLDALPPGERRRLTTSARAWLDANGAWDPAARSLGIHRHTLRARITELETLLTIDLSTFAGRAELWAALEFRERSGLDAPEARGGDRP